MRWIGTVVVMVLLAAGASPGTAQVVDSARSDRHGRFRLASPVAGEHALLFHMDGWALVPSDPFAFESGQRLELDFPVPLVSNAALEQMGDLIGMEPDLQRALPGWYDLPVGPRRR